MNIQQTEIQIQKSSESRLSQVDFAHLDFGDVFSDHMLVCDYSDGKWDSPKIVPYAPLSMYPSMRALHYGQSVFEGMKAYRDIDGDLWLFRPEENARRINTSAKRLAMPEFPVEWFMKGLRTLVSLDREWVPRTEESSLYIRPFMFASEESIRASPAAAYKFIIICSPVGAYYSGEVSVKIADYYSRAVDGGVGFAKAAGNYAGQFYPTQLAVQEGYQQIIWTDAKNHQYLEEAGTMNVFFRVNDTLITAPTGDRILDGITRKSLITLAKADGLKVDERFYKIDELISAAEDGSLKEAFGTGTAAVITPIQSFGYKDKQWTIQPPKESYSKKYKQQILDIQYNRSDDRFGWRVTI